MQRALKNISNSIDKYDACGMRKNSPQKSPQPEGSKKGD